MNLNTNTFSLLILIFTTLVSVVSFAQNGVPKAFNVQGTIYQPGSNNPFVGTANIRFQILNQAATCVMYQETVTGVNTTNTNGAFSVDLGTTATRINNIDSTTILSLNLFKNNVTHPSITGCAGPVVIGANETRKLRISFDVSGSYSDMTPDIEMLTAPYAMIAETLDGHSASEFIMANTSAGLQVSQTNLETLLSNLTKFNTLNNFATSGNITGNAATATTAGTVSDGSITAAKLAQMGATNGQVMKWNGSSWAASSDNSGVATITSSDITTAMGYTPVGPAGTIANATNAVNATNATTATTATNFSGSLSGDVSGTQTATTVNSVGGRTSSQIATSVNDTIAATNANTINTLVKRDGSGNIAVSNVSATNVSSTNNSIQNLYLFDNLNNNRILFKAPNSGITNYTLTLPPTVGSNGQVLSTNASGDLSWVNASGGSVTNVTAASPLISSLGSTPEISLPMATNSQDGYLSSTDRTAFNAKLSDFSTLTSADLSARNALLTSTILSGDVSGLFNAISVDRIRGTNVNISAFTSNDILQYNGTQYVNRNIPTCGVNQYLTFNGTTYTCVTDVGAGGTVGSLNGLTGALNVVSGSSGTDFNINSAATTVTLNFPTSSISNRGLLSSADFTTFYNKQDALGANSVSSSMISSLDWTKISGAPAFITSAALSPYALSSDVTTALSDYVLSSDGRLTDERTPLNNSVTTAKILDGTITSADLSNASIEASKLAPMGASIGEVMKWSGTGWVASADSTGNSGTVTTVTSATTDITISNPTTTPQLTLNAATSGADKILRLDGSGKIDSSTVPTNLLTTASTLSGDVSGTNSTTSIDKIKGTAVSATAPTTNGQVLRYNGSQWVPNFIAMTDLRSSVTGANTFATSCGTNQTLTYNSVGDVMSCSNIAISISQVTGLANSASVDATDASNITTGTLNAGRLPAASSSADGIVNQIAQSFSGIKTFVNNVVMQSALSVSGALSAASATISGAVTAASLSSSGTITAAGAVSASGDITSAGAVNADRIKVANSVATCNGTTEGSLKYNSTSKKIEYCNGTAWTNISAGVLANLSIGSPSSSIVKSGPVTYTVTYGSGVDTATITLSTGNITLGGTDTTGCTVSSVTGSGSTRTVTVNSCSGTGTVNVSVAANTASSTTGDTVPAAGPSTTYQVDNTGPNAPTGVSLGSVPSNLSNSPTITYSAASDVGGSTVANHQVQIIQTSNSSVIRAWANHTSGSDVGSLSLLANTQYSVLVRAVDALGNNGTQTTAVNWTTINDPCLGSPSPGTTCSGGAIFLGSLSPGATSGSGTDKYMTTAGGCSDIPAGSVSGGSGASSYANADFTPDSCSGTDALIKYWNDGIGNWYDIPGLTNYTTTTGTGNGAINTDQYYGSTNTTNIVAITAGGEGGYHAAARYCDKLSWGGYTDWHLPNRAELNLMYTNVGSIPGLDTFGNVYWASTEYSSDNAWVQRFSDGNQGNVYKNSVYRVRCVRRF